MSLPPAESASAPVRGGIFTRLYQWTLRASRHRRAPFWLGTVSFTEASFFPIPPDIMLAPMTLANPPAWWRLALLTTVTSVAGGLLGYFIGLWLIDAAMPWVEAAGYGETYRTAVEWFDRFGFWAIFLAGFTPIPFKVFTIAAGSMGMPLLAFVAGASVGRGLRYGLIAGFVRVVGPTAEARLLRQIDRIGWATVALVVVALVFYGLRE
jgi:membrane protein YqaA with SNARE-associated domain